MAKGLNRVLLLGTVTQTPELRYTPGGLAVLEVTVAGQDRVETEGGELREIPWYHRVKLLGRYAELLAEQLAAGTPVFVEGRLDYRTWESDGQRRSVLEVRVDRIEPLVSDREGRTVTDARGQERLTDALNQVVLIGNLTRDAELRYTPQGTAVTRFGLAVNETFTSRGQEQEKTHFVDVTAWRDLAEWAGELKKGEPVLVLGRLVNDSWTAQDGSRRFVTRVEARRIEKLTRPPEGGAKPAPAGGVDLEDGLDEFPPEEDLPF